MNEAVIASPVCSVTEALETMSSFGIEATADISLAPAEVKRIYAQQASALDQWQQMGGSLDETAFYNVEPNVLNEADRRYVGYAFFLTLIQRRYCTDPLETNKVILQAYNSYNPADPRPEAGRALMPIVSREGTLDEAGVTYQEAMHAKYRRSFNLFRLALNDGSTKPFADEIAKDFLGEEYEEAGDKFRPLDVGGFEGLAGEFKDMDDKEKADFFRFVVSLARVYEPHKDHKYFEGGVFSHPLTDMLHSKIVANTELPLFDRLLASRIITDLHMNPDDSEKAPKLTDGDLDLGELALAMSGIEHGRTGPETTSEMVTFFTHTDGKYYDLMKRATEYFAGEDTASAQTFYESFVSLMRGHDYGGQILEIFNAVEPAEFVEWFNTLAELQDNHDRFSELFEFIDDGALASQMMMAGRERTTDLIYAAAEAARIDKSRTHVLESPHALNEAKADAKHARAYTLPLTSGDNLGLEVEGFGDAMNAVKYLNENIRVIVQAFEEQDLKLAHVGENNTYRLYRFSDDEGKSRVVIYVRPYGSDEGDERFEYGSARNGYDASVSVRVGTGGLKDRRQFCLRLDRKGCGDEESGGVSASTSTMTSEGFIAEDIGAMSPEGSDSSKASRMLALGNLLRAISGSEISQGAIGGASVDPSTVELNHVTGPFSSIYGQRKEFARVAQAVIDHLEVRL